MEFSNMIVKWLICSIDYPITYFHYCFYDYLPTDVHFVFELKEVKSRDETIEEQKTDKKSAARNKRMFGALVGTLQKFNKEEVKKKDVTEKKKIVEMKVEERTEKEKEEIKNRKRELFSDQKKKKKDIQIIQIQMKRVEDYEIWEKSKQQEVNFIRTASKPELYWLPKTHTEKSKGKIRFHLEWVKGFSELENWPQTTLGRLM